MHISCYNMVRAPVAQLDRVGPSEGSGRMFESCRVRQWGNTQVAEEASLES